MAQFWTSKHGTKIDITGLDAKTLAEVKRLADSKYGTKAAEIANSYRKKAGGTTSSGSSNKPATTKDINPYPTQGDVKNNPANDIARTTNTAGTIASNTDFNNINSVAGGQQTINNATAVNNTIRSNPNEVNPYGEKTVTYDANGKPTVTTRLTGGNEQLYNAQTSAGTLGSQVAGGLLQNFNYDPNSVNQKYGIPEVNQDYIQKYQDAAYNSLTRNLEKNYARDKEQKAQDLVNRGIPQGSQQFQDEMNKDVENRYAEQRLAAENQAYSAGLGASQTTFGMGLQANQQANQNYNTSFGNRVAWGNQLNNMSAVRDVNGQPFQAAQTNAANLEGLYGTAVSKKIAEQQIAESKRRAAAGGAGAGAGASNQPAVDL